MLSIRVSIGSVAAAGAVALATTAGAAGPLAQPVGGAGRGSWRVLSAQRWRVMTLPVSRRSAHSFAEPGIASGPGGLLLADAASANTGAPATFWISRDAGRHWKEVRRVDRTGASTGDADAAVGPHGYLYALNLGYNANPPGQPTNPAVLVFRSRPGRAWRGPASFPPPHGIDQPDRPWLVVNPRRSQNVDVVNSEGAGNFVIWRSFSFDHGARFTGPIPVSLGASGQAALALSSRPLFDPTRPGRLFMLYETAGGARPSAGGPLYEFPLTQIWLATSTDAGRHWTSREILDTGALAGRWRGASLGHLLVASAIDRRGRLYAALSVRLRGTTRTSIYLIHSTSHGIVWSRPRRISAPTASNVMPALAVSPGGVAYVAWYGSHNRDFRNARASWSEMLAESPDPLATRPRFIVRRLSGSRPVHVGGIDAAGTVGSDTGANWGLRDFQSIVIGACSEPHIVWAQDHGATATRTATPASACSGDRRVVHGPQGHARPDPAFTG